MQDYENKLFVAKFQLAINQMRRGMSDLYKLAKQHGIKGDSVIHELQNKLGQASGQYYGYHGTYAETFVKSKYEVKKAIKLSPLQDAKDRALRSVYSQLNNKVSKMYRHNVEVSANVNDCGVDLHNGDIRKIVVPITYHLKIAEIGDLSSNKVLVWARPHRHDRYKCWKANYLTWVRKHGRKYFRSVDCFIMKDETSGIVYHHTDYRLCADGMRRAIGRAISKRIG